MSGKQYEFLIFITDKNGKKHDKTSEVEDFYYNEERKLYSIKYTTSNIYYHYKNENVQIIENSLNDKQSTTVFDYLLRMAEFSDIKNDEGQNLLVKNFEKARFVNKDSALARYLNPSAENNKSKQHVNNLIFPFGCNNSQFKAVTCALENQISIIQGPPGTGKTQTILNIVANLIMNNKTVLIVSNNNAATANVYEKLSSEKYGFEFICIKHGKSENIKQFIKEQQSSYPNYIKDWVSDSNTFSTSINGELEQLKNYFWACERISIIQSELAALEREVFYFKADSVDIYPNKKLLKLKSSNLMNLLLKVQYKYSKKEKLGCFMRLRLKHKLGLKIKAHDIDSEKIIRTITISFYETKEKELKTELNENSNIIKEFEPQEVYDKCLKILQKEIGKRYTKRQNKIHFEDSLDVYFNPKLLVKEYPVVFSTTFSSRATVGINNDFLFDYLIMDESSQVDIVTGALALSCAKNAVIVGDKMQLPNVIEENKKYYIQKIFEKTELEQGYNYLNSFLNSLELILPNTPQTLLREHYRCHPKIINFCNQQFYNGKLLIMTEDKGETDVLQVIKTVQGNFCKDHFNQRQIDIIKEELLPKYLEADKLNLGIIAPYNNQVNEIKAQIPEIDVATVHKYQGREKDYIIISTVDNMITNFVDDSNMLNVAISRAKKKLAVIISGNQQPENSNLAALIKYIQYYNFAIEESKVNSIFDFLYTRQTEAKFNFLNATGKISKFNSENAMNNLLNKILKESQYLRFKFVFEMPLKDIVNKQYMMTLPSELSEFANKSWTHVDFTIFNCVTKEIIFCIEVDGYNYHKKGTVQAERDKKKNRIFDIIGISLLRFNTRGSNEEIKIREELNNFIQ